MAEPLCVEVSGISCWAGATNAQWGLTSCATATVETTAPSAVAHQILCCRQPRMPTIYSEEVCAGPAQKTTSGYALLRDPDLADRFGVGRDHEEPIEAQRDPRAWRKSTIKSSEERLVDR